MKLNTRERKLRVKLKGERNKAECTKQHKLQIEGRGTNLNKRERMEIVQNKLKGKE